MSRELPILFNTEMVRAILDGEKTVTRRVIKPHYRENEMGFYIISNAGTGKYDHTVYYDEWEEETRCMPEPYCLGDILYVRETWAFMPCIGCNGDYARPGVGLACYDIQAVEYDDGDSISDGCFVYRADCKKPERVTWRPSIHMPKEAARIWLKVTDVKAERIQDMKLDDFLNEGITVRPEAFNDPENAYGQAREAFKAVWDSTVRKADLDIYGWDANPWVWVIEFEKCEKPEKQAP